MPFVRYCLVIGFVFTGSPIFAQPTPKCGPSGLCEIITEQLSSVVEVDVYSQFGFNRITKTFDGIVSTQLPVGLTSIETSSTASDGFDFGALFSKLLVFFSSREAATEDDQGGESTADDLALYDAEGNNTDEYDVYLEYAQRYNKAKSDLDAAQTRAAKQFLADELRAAEAAWIALGYKFEVEELLRKEAEANSADPAWIAGEIESLSENIDLSVISRSIINQLEGNAWSALSREFVSEQAPTVTFGTEAKRVRRISFDVTHFPTVSVPVLPDYVSDFLLEYFNENQCSVEDQLCSEIQGFLGNLTIVRQVMLIKNVRVWLHDDVSESEYLSDYSLNFISNRYFEATGPYLYMTRRGDFGL